MAEIFEVIVFAGLLMGANAIARPLGGFLYYFLTAVLSVVPIFGPIYRQIINGQVKLIALLKIPAWAISSSGVLIGLGIHNYFWGQPNHPIEFWVLGIITAATILNILYKVILFEQTSFEEIRQYMKENRIFTKPLEMQDENYEAFLDEYRSRFARSNFVDLNMTLFFQLIVSFGVVFYSLAHLGIIHVIPNTAIPTLWQTIPLAFKPLDILNPADAPFTGLEWDIASTVSNFFIFYWVVIHIALATSMVDEGKDQSSPKTSKENYEETVVQELKKYIQRNAPVRIVAALVNPIGKESGAESVTILNTSTSEISLKGWRIVCPGNDQVDFPDTILPAGDTLKLILGNNARLVNKGGTISLFDAQGSLINEVSYTDSDAREQGRTIIF